MASPTPLRSDSLKTRARMLDVARRLFAQRGIDATPLHEIARAAGQRNNSAVPYHFGDKEGVLRSIIGVHALELDAERLRLLDALPAGNRVQLRQLIDILVRPLATQLDTRRGLEYLRVTVQLISHPTYPLMSFDASWDLEGVRRLTQLLRAKLPEVTDAVADARITLLLSMLLNGVLRLADFKGRQREAQLENLIDCVESLLTAPVSRATKARLA
ncbi:MAG TPA: helix-turn-helix domain-containing protein [Verrucomicrobiae bacterium]|nr:helix-turn-helix domain-containing protein [Verrucomicrobiae bacterium]